MEFVNLTPHAINFVDENGEEILRVPPSGKIARFDTTIDVIGAINGIPVTQTLYGKLKDLPDPEFGVAYIVSSLVAMQIPNRDDVFIPNESVRDSEGRIIGCKSLGKV